MSKCEKSLRGVNTFQATIFGFLLLLFYFISHPSAFPLFCKGTQSQIHLLDFRQFSIQTTFHPGSRTHPIESNSISINGQLIFLSKAFWLYYCNPLNGVWINLLLAVSDWLDLAWAKVSDKKYEHKTSPDMYLYISGLILKAVCFSGCKTSRFVWSYGCGYTRELQSSCMCLLKIPQ